MNRRIVRAAALCLLLSGCARYTAAEITVTENAAPLYTAAVTESAAPAAETAEPEVSEAAGVPETAEALETAEAAADSAPFAYVLNTNTKKFHLPTCSSVSQMKEKNRENTSASREELIARGMEPCKNCKP